LLAQNEDDDSLQDEQVTPGDVNHIVDDDNNSLDHSFITHGGVHKKKKDLILNTASSVFCPPNSIPLNFGYFLGETCL
jgi:hypothetical protein